MNRLLKEATVKRPPLPSQSPTPGVCKDICNGPTIPASASRPCEDSSFTNTFTISRHNSRIYANQIRSITRWDYTFKLLSVSFLGEI
jgi:hypothetical protein